MRLTKLQRWLIIGAGALIFLLLATGSVFFGLSVGRNAVRSVVPAPQSSSPSRATPASVVQPAAIPTC
jgi:hypothetical protein